MPGSLPDPRSYANTAIDILEEAYIESQGSHAGTLILKAIETITRLKEEIKDSAKQNVLNFDPYEYDESNTAI